LLLFHNQGEELSATADLQVKGALAGLTNRTNRDTIDWIEIVIELRHKSSSNGDVSN
jgi:CRISPR/Cas system-associated exonuclease Cas4 (RecB family)